MNQKKLTRLLIIIVTLFIVLIALTVIVLNLQLTLETQLFIFLIIGLLFYFIMINLKNKFEKYNFLVQNEKLFSNLSSPFKIDIQPFSPNYEAKAKSEEMGYHSIDDHLKTYFAFKHFEPNMSKSRTLVMYNFIDENISFNDPKILDEIGEVDKEISKKSKYNHKVIYVLKVATSKSKEKQSEVNFPFWLKRGQEHLVMLQAYIFLDTMEIYFINNNSFSPTRYYKFASDELIRFFKK